MNRLLMKSLAAGLALTVAGTSTASAGSWDHYRRRDYSQERYYRHDDHRGEYAAIGVGLLALGLIAGMSSKTHTVTESYTYYTPPPPPPPPPVYYAPPPPPVYYPPPAPPCPPDERGGGYGGSYGGGYSGGYGGSPYGYNRY